MDKRFIALLFTILPFFLFSNGTLKGIITDKETQEPIIGAVVSSNTGQGTTSGIDGDYELSLPSGNYLITFSLVGYAPYQKEVSFVDGETVVIDVTLNIKEEIFDDLVISGSLYEKRASEEVISIEVLKPELKKKNIIIINRRCQTSFIGKSLYLILYIIYII